ncbi:hypothetical protein [Thalassotalea ganghwensis]
MKTLFKLIEVMVLLLVFTYHVNAIANSYVAGANYSNGQLYALCFNDLAPNQAPLRSTISADAGVKPVSLAFYTGKTDELGKEELQLFAADEAGVIRRFSWGETTEVGTEPQKDCNAIVIQQTGVLYDKNQGAGPQSPDGLVILPGDKLLVLNSSNGGGASQVWLFDLLLPNSAPQLLIDNIPHNTLAESVLIPSNANSVDLQEDVLIVVNEPSAVLRIDKNCYQSNQCLATDVSYFINENQLPGTPSGIAFIPPPNQDKLIVSMSGGTIASFDIGSGQAQVESSEFITGLGAGKFKVKSLRDVNVNNVNNDEVLSFEANIYIAGRNNGSIKEMKVTVSNDQLVLVNDQVQEVNIGIEHPRALATTSDDFIRIDACTTDCPDNIVVDISTVIQHSWDPSALTGENLAGYIGESYHVLKDPRPACQLSNEGSETQPLYISNDNVYMVEPNDPNRVMIPAHLCGSPAEDPYLILVRTVSDIDPQKTTIAHKAYNTDFNEDGVADLDCYSADRERQPALGWAPIPELAEDPIVEGQQIIDTATGCGSVRSATREWSYFVIGLRYQLFPLPTSKSRKKSAKEYTSKFGEIISEELTSLANSITEASNIPACDVNSVARDEVLAEIITIQDNIASNLNNKTLNDIESEMLSVLNKVRDNDIYLSVADKSAACPKNYRGTFVSRATHLYFSIATKMLEKVWVENCPSDSPVENCF